MNPAQDPPEDELARRFRSGDVDALCALFARYEGLLRARIERHLSPAVRRRISVSDVLQESRVVALDRCGDFEPRGEGAFRKWILGIVEKKARRAVQWHAAVEMRSVRREVPPGNRPETGQFAGRGPTPSQVAVGSETEEIARRAMAALPEDYRHVLHLVREAGLSLVEAAERLGRSHEATKKLYGRALARFGREFHQRRGQSHG